MLRSDPARPRVTFYEDTPGPTHGERIELSGKVLTNWISKAGNALQDEFDLGPGSVVRLALPPHWRALYWAFAVWSVGGTVDLAGVKADLLICDDPQLAASGQPPATDVVLVTLPALARIHPGTVPTGAMDEARDLATYGDQFAARGQASPDDAALITETGLTAYRSVVPQGDWPARARVSLAGDLTQVLTSTLAAWAVDGSVVLARNGQQTGSRAHPERLVSEGVTLDLA
jgi:uncharacterized protein (TIGR03089 family)